MFGIAPTNVLVINMFVGAILYVSSTHHVPMEKIPTDPLVAVKRQLEKILQESGLNYTEIDGEELEYMQSLGTLEKSETAAAVDYDGLPLNQEQIAAIEEAITAVHIPGYDIHLAGSGETTHTFIIFKPIIQ